MTFTTTYEALRRAQSNRLRRRVREHALSVYAALDAVGERRERALATPRLQVLYLHHVFEDEEERLRVLLRRLQRHHTFISYSDAVELLISGRIDRPYITFSSDDGFMNNRRAADILREFGASACFFVCPAMVGVRDADRIRAFNTERLHFPPVEYLGWDDLEAMRAAGHEVGNHTMHHLNLAETAPERVVEEIERGREALVHRLGSARHFSWPYGRFFHFNEHGRRSVFAAGHRSCASAERGCHVKPAAHPLDPETLCIRRDQIVLGWPLSHILYFIARNARRATAADHTFPYTRDGVR